MIAEVAAADSAALLARFHFMDAACTDQPGPGLPPPCRTAGPPGTPVSVFPVGACEDGWADDATPLVRHLLDAGPTLHSVVAYGDPATYDVIFVAPFARDPGLVEVLRLTVEGDVIVRFDEGCGPLPPPVTDLEQPEGAEVIRTGPGAAG